MKYTFNFDKRLGISLPVLSKEWDEYAVEEQEQILAEWEEHRADIPIRIKLLEQIIEQKQHHLNHEEDFKISCELNFEISRLASTINDLNIWFRIQQESKSKTHT